MKRLLADRRRVLIVVGAVLLAGYALLAAVLATGKDWSDSGPLAFDQPPLAVFELAELGHTPSELEQACFPARAMKESLLVMSGLVGGNRYFACYDAKPGGTVYDVVVVDAGLVKVKDPAVLKPSGVWPWYGVVKSVPELVLGAFGCAALFVVGALTAIRVRRPTPRPTGARPWWGHPVVLVVLALIPVIGWVAIAVLPRVPGGTKTKTVLIAVSSFGLLVVLGLLFSSIDKQDVWGIAVLGYLLVTLVVALLLGWWAAPAPAAQPAAGAPAATSGSPLPPPVVAAAAPAGAGEGEDLARVEHPGRLPTFAQVGGMASLKAELKDSLGLLLAFGDHADAYRITWNGILLHGRPGTGKTFIAKATAGEFGLSFLHVATGDLVSSYRGESARNVKAVFRQALRNVPCVLFFDEVDSVAQRRDDNPDQEARRTVNQLLQSLEEHRAVRELVVMAATNDLGSLDRAVIRPGRFDRHIHVPLPDQEGRAAVLAAQLQGRPGAALVDVAEVARRTDGLTPAALTQVVASASLQALEETATSAAGSPVPLTTERLLAAVASRGGQDRPQVGDWTWERLVLPEATVAELRQIASLLAHPELAQQYGVDPPSGVLLYGPPGTGKTTVAKVLAAQSNCSFYAVSAAELTSKWLGESERLISQLFERARDNRPSIVFIDEIDAVAGVRGDYGTYDRQVNQLLQEIDGIDALPGVLVVGATNRKDMLDPALLRGGRLARHVEIALPDRAGRLRLLELFTKGMPLEAVNLDELASRTDGYSGADLEALAHEAGVQAMIRNGDAARPNVTAADFATALATRVPAAQAQPPAERRRAREGYV